MEHCDFRNPYCPMKIPKSAPLIPIFLLVLNPSHAVDTAGKGVDRARPNVLFLLSDDHSYPYLGCYGTPDLTTPHLDRLAAEGARVDHA